MGKLLKDDTYKSAMDQKNALLEVLASDKIDMISSDWSAVSQLVKSGYAQYVYQPGDQFSDKWTDTAASNKEYTYPWHIASFRNVSLDNNQIVPGMIIQSHYAHPFGVQFSHERAFLRCPDGLSAGTYYFTIEQNWGNNVKAGDIVCFTLGSSVPAGGRIAGCYGAPNQAKTNWRIYVYDAEGKTQLEGPIVPTFEVSGTSLGTQKPDTRNGNLNSTQEMAYGWNRWKTSALRQYLNSDKTKGNWWTPQDEWDIAPDQLSSKDGFLCGMPEELLAVIKPVKITTYTNTVQDGGEADITYDKVFVPSLQEIYVNPQISGEGEPWEYWRQASGSSTPLAQNGAYPQMITYAVENHSSAQGVRLRSAYRSNALSSWYVTSGGNVGNNSASYPYSFGAACVIC